MLVRIRLDLIVAVSACVVLLWRVPSARANDTSMGGPGSALYPIEETRISMLSERIDATLVPSDDHGRHLDWSIRADYEFRNDATGPVTLNVGFPELCEKQFIISYSDTRSLRHFRAFRTFVNGSEVAVQIGKVDRTRPGLEHMCLVYHFEVTFPTGTTRVVHEYIQSPSASLGGYSFDYITETGAYWNGPIGSATFTLRTPWWPDSINSDVDPGWAESEANRWRSRIDLPGAGAGTGFALSYLVGHDGTGFVGRFTRQNWDGSGNVHVVIGHDNGFGSCRNSIVAPPCPHLSSSWADLAEVSDLMIQDCVQSLGGSFESGFLLNPELHAIGPGEQRSAFFDRVRLEKARRSGACASDGLMLPTWLTCSRAALAAVVRPRPGSWQDRCNGLLRGDE